MRLFCVSVSCVRMRCDAHAVLFRFCLDGWGGGYLFGFFPLEIRSGISSGRAGSLPEEMPFCPGGERIMKVGRIIPEAVTDGDIPSALPPTRLKTHRTVKKFAATSDSLVKNDKIRYN